MYWGEAHKIHAHVCVGCRDREQGADSHGHGRSWRSSAPALHAQLPFSMSRQEALEQFYGRVTECVLLAPEVPDARRNWVENAMLTDDGLGLGGGHSVLSAHLKSEDQVRLFQFQG